MFPFKTGFEGRMSKLTGVSGTCWQVCVVSVVEDRTWCQHSGGVGTLIHCFVHQLDQIDDFNLSCLVRVLNPLLEHLKAEWTRHRDLVRFGL